jgi:hypothetical protein
MRVERVLAVAVVFLFLVGLGFSQTQGRVAPYRVSIIDEGLYLGTCSEGFDILWDDVAVLRGMVRYDKDGNPVQDVYQFKIIGQTIYYNSTNPDKFVLGGPGEAAEGRIVYSEDGTPVLGFEAGLAFKVMLKGYGTIFFNTGLAIYDPETHELLFKAGPAQFWEKDIAAMCNALK